MEYKNRHMLFGKGVHGVRVWEIWSQDQTIFINANGQQYTEFVPEGKASRSLAEQVKLRVDARVRGKLDSGFKYSREEAEASPTNQLDLPMPMLAKKYEGKFSLRNCFLQPKLDGHRCLITRDNEGKIVAYSRRGKYIDTVDHILDHIDLPDGIVLDGELYCHGESLQTIASWAKRRQPSSLKLNYHTYDLIETTAPALSFIERYERLQDIVDNSNSLELVDTIRVKPNDDIPTLLAESIMQGYEGLIARPIHGQYGIGKRSSDLLKIKRRLDAEFQCVDVIPSREGWGILVLRAANGLLFKSLAPGTIADKVATLKMKELYIGKWVTAEFACYTDTGIPFHAACTRWRSDI